MRPRYFRQRQQNAQLLQYAILRSKIVFLDKVRLTLSSLQFSVATF